MRHLVRQNRGDRLSGADRCRFGLRQQVGFTIENRAGVFHRPGREIGNRDDVELAEGIFDGVVGVVEPEHLLRRFERDPRQLALVRRRADPDRDVVGGALDALEIADRHRHQVGRHLRRGGELHRMLRCRRAGHVGQHAAVGNRDVTAIDGQRHGERRLERRFVEARKGAACVGRLELRHGVFPEFGLADVEPAQLGVQHTAECRVDLVGSLRQWLRHGERGRLRLLVERNGGDLHGRAGANRDLAEIELQRVQHHLGGRFLDVDLDRLGSFEPLFGEVDNVRQFIVRRHDRHRKALRRRGQRGENCEGEQGQQGGAHSSSVSRNLTPSRIASYKGWVVTGQSTCMCTGCCCCGLFASLRANGLFICGSTIVR
jgi:hypothetical protein